VLEDFANEFMNSESYYTSTLMDSCVCIRVSEFMGGCGLSMKQLMDYKNKQY
jgi:hypothetical protein